MDNFDLDRIGKKMPYRVPDSFFMDVEHKILEKTRSGCKKPRISIIPMKLIYGVGATAAVIALLLNVVGNDRLHQEPDFSEISQAFDCLSEADQAYLLETYQEDIFIDYPIVDESL